MLKKTNKLLAALLITISLLSFAPLSVFADNAPCGDTCTNNAGSNSSSNDPCAGVIDIAGAPSCAQCHPNSGKATSQCACYPQYYGGQALTDQQLSSCRACNKTNGLGYNAANTKSCLQNNIIIKRLNELINVLAGIALLVIVGVIMGGGIQYAMAGKPEDAAQARKRITNAMIALFSFFFIWAFLQWLIPGGV